jgi:SPP1 gp7 family putative phage head morphogenesis protein
MKREVCCPNGAKVKSPEPPKSEIRQFGNAIEYMVDQMAQRWRNQIFSELNQDTVAKFADSVAMQDAKQSGNFAKVFLAMAARVQRKLLKQFDGKRLDKMTNKYTGKVNRRNQSEFYRRVSASVGISREELEATEGLTFQINAFQAETQQWVKKMRDDTLQQWTSNTLRSMAEGKSLPEIMKQFDGMVEQRRGHAKMVARTQIATFNSLTSKARAQNLGIKKAVWKTSMDERVRACHQVRDGKEYLLSEGLYSSCDGKTLQAGTDYNCRCTAIMVIPEMEQ